MISIGERRELIKKLELDILEQKKMIETQTKQLSKLEESIRDLEKSQLPIKLLVALEDHNHPHSNTYSSDYVYWMNVYYLPDIDTIHLRRDYSCGRSSTYANELDLTAFYKSGHNEFSTRLIYPQVFASEKDYHQITDEAVADVKSRINRILSKNTGLEDWSILGKLLFATYYNL